MDFIQTQDKSFRMILMNVQETGLRAGLEQLERKITACSL